MTDESNPVIFFTVTEEILPLLNKYLSYNLSFYKNKLMLDKNIITQRIIKQYNNFL